MLGVIVFEKSDQFNGSDKCLAELATRVPAQPLTLGLRWPNTVFARAFADAIQHVHKDFKKRTCRQYRVIISLT